MIKTSTLIYSIHNLASKSTFSFKSTEELFAQTEFNDVNSLLSQLPLEDVKQDVVNNILNFAKSFKA